MQKIFISLAIPVIMFAKTYSGCGDSNENAKLDLVTNISAKIEFKENKAATSMRDAHVENVQTTIEQYSSVTSNLELVDIKIIEKNGQICASVEKAVQTDHTKKLLNKVLVYSEKDLPKSSFDKLTTLKFWLSDLEQLTQLFPVFLDDITIKEKEFIYHKQKLFKDIYSQTQLNMDSLIWKSCNANRDEALKGLNQKLFNKKEKEDGFFNSLTKIFTSEEKDPLIHLLQPQISYTHSGANICAVINKESLLNISQKMYADAKRYQASLLPEDPKTRYTQIENYTQHLQVTTSLISLFPKSFSSADKNYMDQKVKSLNKIKKTTYPQYVIFNVQSETPETILLDGKLVAKNEKIHLKVGDHSYKITASDRCDITGDINVNLFEEETISASFSSLHYPTILFITDKRATAMVNGDTVSLNKTTPIKKCEGDVQYLVKFASQNRMETITLSPEKKFSIELNFLNPDEINIFNNAKTKYYSTLQDEKFSESLTPIQSSNLVFDVEDSPKNGSLNLNKSGHFVYTPNEGFSGKDSFEYTISSPQQESSPRVVIVKVEENTPNLALYAPVKEDKNTAIKDEMQEKQNTQEETKVVNEDIDEEKYQRFKSYVNSQEQDIEKLQKIQKKYPSMFKQLLQEKLAN